MKFSAIQIWVVSPSGVRLRVESPRDTILTFAGWKVEIVDLVPDLLEGIGRTARSE